MHAYDDSEINVDEERGLEPFVPYHAFSSMVPMVSPSEADEDPASVDHQEGMESNVHLCLESEFVPVKRKPVASCSLFAPFRPVGRSAFPKATTVYVLARVLL